MMTEEVKLTTKNLTLEERKEIREHLIEQDKRAAFMRHLYHSYGRNNPEHEMHGFYTGLWQEFKEEAALIVREQFFERLEAVRLYEENKVKEQEANVYTSPLPESDSNDGESGE